MTHAPVGIFVLFAVVLIPVYIFIIASLVGRPRAPKVALLMLGLPISLIIAFIFFMWLFGTLVSLIVP